MEELHSAGKRPNAPKLLPRSLPCRRPHYPELRARSADSFTTPPGLRAAALTRSHCKGLTTSSRGQRRAEVQTTGGYVQPCTGSSSPVGQ